MALKREHRCRTPTVDPRCPWPILYVPKVHGSLERRGGISLDDLRTLLGAGPAEISTTALPDEMSVSISVEHERASVSVLATVPTEYVDTRVFPSLGYVITAADPRDVDAALEWLMARCKTTRIAVRPSVGAASAK